MIVVERRLRLLKRDAVLDLLEEQGVRIDDEFIRNCIVPKVIFTNPNLDLDPEVEARPDVISRRELEGYLGRQSQRGLAERMFSSIIDFCLESEAKRGVNQEKTSGMIPEADYRRIVACLAATSTWDRLECFGTRIVTGDVVSLKIGSQTFRRPELSEISRSLPIRLRWTRGWLWGLVKVLTGLGSLGEAFLGKTLIPIDTADTVMFHLVGEREATLIRLMELDQIVLG